jgi:hypothetical protein
VAAPARQHSHRMTSTDPLTQRPTTRAAVDPNPVTGPGRLDQHARSPGPPAVAELPLYRLHLMRIEYLLMGSVLPP